MLYKINKKNFKEVTDRLAKVHGSRGDFCDKVGFPQSQYYQFVTTKANKVCSVQEATWKKLVAGLEAAGATPLEARACFHQKRTPTRKTAAKVNTVTANAKVKQPFNFTQASMFELIGELMNKTGAHTVAIEIDGHRTSISHG